MGPGPDSDREYHHNALLKRTDNRLTSVAPVNDLLSDTATAQTCAFQGSQILLDINQIQALLV